MLGLVGDDICGACSMFASDCGTIPIATKGLCFTPHAAQGCSDFGMENVSEFSEFSIAEVDRCMVWLTGKMPVTLKEDATVLLGHFESWACCTVMERDLCQLQ